MMLTRRDARRIWTAPVLIGVLTATALVTALLAEGWWDRLAALLLFSSLVFPLALGLRSGAGRDRG